MAAASCPPATLAPGGLHHERGASPSLLSSLRSSPLPHLLSEKLPLQQRGHRQSPWTCASRPGASGESARESIATIPGKKGGQKEKLESNGRQPRGSKGVKEGRQGKAGKTWAKSWVPWWGWDGTVEEDTSSLEGWLRAEGLPPQKVTLNPVMEGERGLLAKQDIGKGEMLLYVPEKLLITAETVYRCPRVGAFLKKTNVPDWPALAVYILSEAALGNQSEWSPYIEALPQNPGCILMWSLEEVDTLLEGSPLRQKAIEVIAEVTETFRDLDTVLFSKHPDVFPPQVFTLGAFKWAFSILFSRMVRLQSLGGTLALVPWADMINHKSDVGAYLDFDPSSRTVVLKTDRTYGKGQQVYVSYGPRPNGELLLAYGMVPSGRNPHNSVEISLGLNSADPLLETKQRALATSGVTSPSSFPLKMEGLPAQLEAYARLVAAGPTSSSESLQELAKAAAANSSSEPFGGWDLRRGRESPEEGAAAREVILAACQVALKGYPTTLEEDEEIASQQRTTMVSTDMETDLKEIEQAAAALRVSERKILYRADTILRSELRDLKRLEAAKAGRPTVPLGNNEQGKGPLDAFLRKIVNPW